MSVRRVLLVVEGQHDEAFIATLLRARHGFAPERLRSRVDRYWEKTIPTTFPHDDDLRRRMPVPYFYTREDVSLAIIVAVGESRLVDVIGDTLAVLPDPPVDAIGVVLDADDRRAAGERHAMVRKGLADLELVPGAAPGQLGAVAPCCGIYVLPDNASSGTLENILIECAERNYQAAVAAARSLVDGVNPKDYRGDDLRELNKPAGKNKSIVATITAILKPGKTTQTSISDNRWLHGEAASLPSVSRFESFLEALLTAGGMAPGPAAAAPQEESRMTAEVSTPAAEAPEREDQGE